MKHRAAVVAAAVASHPIVLYIINDTLGWYEVKQIIFVPIMGWSPAFLLYLIGMQSRLASFLGGLVILVGYPTNIALVASDDSSTAAIGLLSIPFGIIVPCLLAIRILDALIGWAVSKFADRLTPNTKKLR